MITSRFLSDLELEAFLFDFKKSCILEQVGKSND